MRTQLVSKEAENTALKAELEKGRRDNHETIKHYREKNKVVVSDLVKTLKAAEASNDRLKEANSQIDSLNDQLDRMRLQKDNLWQSLQVADEKLLDYQHKTAELQCIIDKGSFLLSQGS